MYDRDRYSLGVILDNSNRYMLSLTKRLDATKSILLAPFYYNWIAPLFNNPLLKERTKLITLLKQHDVIAYRDEVRFVDPATFENSELINERKIFEYSQLAKNKKIEL